MRILSFIVGFIVLLSSSYGLTSSIPQVMTGPLIYGSISLLYLTLAFGGVMWIRVGCEPTHSHES